MAVFCSPEPVEVNGRHYLVPKVPDPENFYKLGQTKPRTESKYFRVSTLAEDCLEDSV